MPRKFFEKHFKDDKFSIKDNKIYKLFFARFLGDPNLWHLNRRSVAGGMANGMFWGFVPLPIQTIGTVSGAIFFRVNLPISIAATWVTNPFTMVPIFYFTYKLGTFILQQERIAIDKFNFSFEWFINMFAQIWQPLILGSLLVGSILSFLTYIIINGLWRLSIVAQWKKRQKNTL